MKNIILLLSLIAISIFLSGCIQQLSVTTTTTTVTTTTTTTISPIPTLPEETTTTQLTQTHSVDITGLSFSPAELRINAGDTVIWTNRDSVSHTVTSDTGNELNSPTLSQNQQYSHTFATAGTFNYHCTPHSFMKAKVIVE
jgi:amicyanin